MIEFLSESSGNIVGIRFTGKLTRSDYRDVLTPRVDSLLKRFAALRVLVLIDDAFAGWTLSAAWANTAFDVRHRRNFEKIAIVGAPQWEEWCARIAAAVLVRGELRTYPHDRLDHAWEWLSA